MKSDALTPAEQAYFDSNGADADALLAENAGAAGAGAAHGAASGEGAPNGAGPADAGAAGTLPEADPAAAAAAAASAAPAPELGEEEIPSPDGKTKRRMVDSRALKEARSTAAALEKELQHERDIRARIDERLKMLTAVVEQPDPATAAAAPGADDPEPDPEADIFAYVKWQNRQIARLKEEQTEVRTQTEQERQTTAIVRTYSQDAATFRSQKPDFNDAYNFLLTKRGEQLAALGYAPDDVRSFLYTEEMNLVSRAIGQRQSPSAQIYALATSMGYAPKAPGAPADPAAAGSTLAAAATAAAPAAPAPAPAAPSVTAEIDRIKAGQASSRSLSAGGGAAGEGLSLETLSNMPEKEFIAWLAKPGNREALDNALGARAA
jgi:hypothetical protein